MTRFRSLFALAAVALVASTVSAQLPTPVDPNAPHILTVTGQDSVRIPATLAQLSIVIAAQEETAAAATAAVTAPSQTVLAYLQEKAADRIQAGALTLSPVYSRRKVSSTGDSEPVITGYTATWNATFTVPADRAGDFAAGVIDAGANRITRFDFLASDDALAAARNEALQGATRQARDTAVAVLTTLDKQLRDVVRIHVNSNGPVRPLARGGVMHAMAMEASSAPAAVEPGFIEVDGNVTLEVRY